MYTYVWASQVALVVKNLPANAGDVRDACLIPGLGRSPGGGNSVPLQYSCLENPMDKEPGGLQSVGLQRFGHDWSNLAAAAAKSLQSCPTLCDPIDGSPPGSPVPGFSRQEHWSGLPFPSPMQESEKSKWSRSVVSDSLWPHAHMHIYTHLYTYVLILWPSNCNPQHLFQINENFLAVV